MYWVFKGILKPILMGLYSIKVEGRGNVPKNGPAIIAANHLSFLDSFFIPLVVKRRKVTYLAKADYFKSWKTAWFFNMVGQIPTEREGGKKSENALNSALEVLRDSKLLGIYPEGTRSPDGRLYRGKTGVARIALESGAPVIPVAMLNADDIQPIGKVLPRLIRPRIRFGAPLDFSRYAGMAGDRFIERAVTDEIMYEIMRLSGQEYVDIYASQAKEESKRGDSSKGDDQRKLAS